MDSSEVVLLGDRDRAVGAVTGGAVSQMSRLPADSSIGGSTTASTSSSTGEINILRAIDLPQQAHRSTELPTTQAHDTATTLKVPLWIYSVIGLLAVGLLVTVFVICVYLKLRRKWKRQQRERSQSAASSSTHEGGSRAQYMAATSPPQIFASRHDRPMSGAHAVSHKTPEMPPARSKSTNGGADGNGNSKKARRGWFNAGSGSLHHALSRLSGPDVASGGSSDSRSFKVDKHTVSYGSRFHVAQSPDASVHFRVGGGRRGSIPHYPYPKQGHGGAALEAAPTGNW
eukprot:scpid95076/ scgid34401/ 